MDFFRPPPRPERPLNVPKMPDWIHKPSDEIGILLPHAAVIARSKQALVALAGFRVYSKGVEILLMLRTLSEFTLEDPTGFRELMRRRIDPKNDSLPDTVFRFGVEFSDGRRATNLDRNWGGPDWQTKPPPRVIAFVSEYPQAAIALTRYEVEAAPILEAASRSIKLWENGT